MIKICRTTKGHSYLLLSNDYQFKNMYEKSLHVLVQPVLWSHNLNTVSLRLSSSDSYLHNCIFFSVLFLDPIFIIIIILKTKSKYLILYCS